jgi:signal transduction histidine kinase
VYRRRNGTWTHRLFGEDDGLLAQVVPGLDISPDGRRLWLATHRGIQGLRLDAGPPRLDALVELRARDGLEGEQAGAVLEDSDGFLWAALVPGKVHRLDWRALATRSPSPAVALERVEVNGRPAAFGAGALRLRQGDGLAVGLWPQTYRQPARVRIEYRLDGGDTAWTDLGTARTLTLAALPVGRYAFQARAVRQGQAPGPAAQLLLAVSPPFYRAPWFFALVGLSLGLAGYGAWRLREGRRRAADALRLHIAADLHDEVGSGLTEVSLYSELIRREVEGAEGSSGDGESRVAAWAAHVGEQSRALSSATRDIVWAIRPAEAGWDALELRLKDTAAGMLGSRGIEADLGGEVEDVPALSPEVRQHVLRFAKEALHNAIRYADATRVTVRWHVSRRRLSLQVCDDGRGFDPASVEPGTGLISLRRRAEMLGGTFGIDSHPGRGTCLALDIPLQSRGGLNPFRAPRWRPRPEGESRDAEFGHREMPTHSDR